jgi:hypothetical protein
MDATADFSLRLPRASESKVETTNWLLSRQLLQRIATRISLVSETIGFSIFGILIIVNRYQAELNGFSGGSSLAMVGGICALLVGTIFLVAAWSIGGSAPSIRPRCRSGIIRSVSLSLDPIPSQQWLWRLRRHQCSREEK